MKNNIPRFLKAHEKDFKKVLEKYFNGELDEATINLIQL